MASSYQRHAAPRNRALDVMWQDGKQVRSDRHVDQENLPQDAQTSALTNADFRQKVKDGHRIQRNEDGTATYWKAQSPEKVTRNVEPRRKRVSPTFRPRSSAGQSSAVSLNVGQRQQVSSPQRGQTRSDDRFTDGAAQARRVVDEVLSPTPPTKPAPRPRAAQLVAAHQQRVQTSQQASQPWKTARTPAQRSGRPRPKLR